MFETYEDIVANGIWLEDRGAYSRYATEGEESIWVHNDREEIADPDEDDMADEDDE